MPAAICNQCNELVMFKGLLKKQICKCGSKDLSAVAAKLNMEKQGYDYYDRSQKLRKFVEFGKTS